MDDPLFGLWLRLNQMVPIPFTGYSRVNDTFYLGDVAIDRNRLNQMVPSYLEYDSFFIPEIQMVNITVEQFEQDRTIVDKLNSFDFVNRSQSEIALDLLRYFIKLKEHS